MSLLQGINVVSIAVPDLDKGRDFYRNVLELGEPVYDLPDVGWIEFKLGAQSGHVALTTAEKDWQPSAGITIVMDTADCYAACKTLRDRGVRCDDPVVIPGMVTYFNFYDPFGNRLQGCSAPPAQ
ncbi:MAG: VOC family protein [Anaerolineaceae bacterium]|nr:VOC family protein [Anaerolineaceae bacterium]